MADDADRAEETIENRLSDALAEVRRAPSLVPCEACHYCGNPLTQAGHLFCDVDCRSDYQAMQDARKRNGQ